MGKVELKNGVYWVGAIDWNIRDFHGYTTPRGTTYNAYLIVDEKIALVDTVKSNFAEEMLERISEIVNPEDIDYLVSNHVEKDHSGSVTEVMRLAKNAKVVATERGKAGLTRYYKGNWPFVTVKTGDKIELGEKTLEFIEAPMLHWPDSMFTYVRKEQLLLPNDAFGQHIASSKRFEDEVENVMDEAAKYYANILMPFAPLILKKIQEIQAMGLAIDMIAPSHGVIWRSEPERIIEAYVRWSEGVAEQRVLVVYDTMWGSTEVIAEAILKGIMSEGVETRLFHLRKSDQSEILKEILDAKAVLVGSPTLNNGMFPSVSGFLTYLKGLRPKGKIGAAFGSYGWGKGAVKAVKEELEKAGFEVLEADLEFQYAPDEKEINRCIQFGKELAKKIKAEGQP